ncbi:MAG: cardiolipin synthase, partial [Muribaculaceae bacterium]|nr:cardiolipin synthase [Muribaculaceae bacterium]
AKHSVWIQTPYFLPSESLLRALQSAALAKVDVRLMIPLNPDSAMLRYASFSFVKECLQSGIKVYLYQPGMLHSKMMIVDNELVTIGSTNFDFRSFEHNFEGNLFIYSQEFNRRMREQYLADQAESRRVIPFEWQRRALSKKLLESLTRIFSPIL